MTLNGYGKARILYPEELDALIDAIPYSHHKVLATVLRFTGARCTEVAKSKWKNYNGKILMLPKPDTKTDNNDEDVGYYIDFTPTTDKFFIRMGLLDYFQYINELWVISRKYSSHQK